MNKQKKWYITVGKEKIEVSEEVYRAYWHYTEKEKYFMGKLKQGGFVSSQEEETAKFISSREDSLERLSEHGIQFEDTSTPSPDDVVIKDDLFFLLNQALSKLSEEEKHLIQELFYYEKTEREVCEALHYPDAISRFARNTRDLLELVEQLTSKGVEFVSKKEAIDTTTPTGKFMLTIFGAVAELEREYILQRQREGISIAKAQGKYTGRKATVPSNFDNVVAMWRDGEITAVEAMRRLKMSKSAFYRRVKTHPGGVHH